MSCAGRRSTTKKAVVFALSQDWDLYGIAVQRAGDHSSGKHREKPAGTLGFPEKLGGTRSYDLSEMPPADRAESEPYGDLPRVRSSNNATLGVAATDTFAETDIGVLAASCS